MPASTQSPRKSSKKWAGEPLNRWVHSALVVMLCALVTVFVTAWRIYPYDEDGSARRMSTHQQLGLPPCTFADMTGVPCPACGMTTSFSLLVRGDVANSARANWVGTLLAAFCMLVIPWAVVSTVTGRAVFVRSSSG